MAAVDKEQFIFAAGKVLPSLSHQFVARVIGVRNDGSYEHRGTALMTQFGARQAFVTALHVLTEIEKGAEFRSFGFSEMFEGYVEIHRFEGIDVAVVLLNDQIEPSEGHRFWPADQSDAMADGLEADYLLVHGYPDLFARYTEFLPGFVAEAYTHCSAIRPRESSLPKDAVALVNKLLPNYTAIQDSLLKPKQFAINYAEDTGPLKTVDGEVVTSVGILESHSRLYTDGVALPGQPRHGAFGLSGSPVWRFGARECGWKPENWAAESARLTGIVTGWNEGHHILIATPFCEIVSRLNKVL